MNERWPEPYQLLFPLGIAFALAGVAPWWLSAFGAIGWPGLLHMTLMIQGFEQSFVMGFLLTAMPAFSGGHRCRPWESGCAVILLLAFALSAIAGPALAAQLAYVLSLALLIFALSTRVVRARKLPPEEFIFVGLGLCLGLAGAGVIMASDGLGWAPPALRLGQRLQSLGMVLSIVLGVGGLLVPTFSGMPDPLRVPGFAGPHERPGRRVLYLPVALLLLGAFILEVLGHARAGALTRALGATALLMLVWKLWRRPRAAGILPNALRASGWLIFIGLWLAVLWPSGSTAAYHVVFVGGFGLLTLGVGTRVVVAHGRHPSSEEKHILSMPVVIGLLLALVLRLAAALDSKKMIPALAASATIWMLTWTWWAVRAIPKMVLMGKPPGEIVIAKPKSRRG